MSVSQPAVTDRLTAGCYYEHLTAGCYYDRLTAGCY